MKRRSGGKYLLEESKAPTIEEVVENTFGKLSILGGQTFAFSPFSQYFDDWLLSLKSVISEFESHLVAEVDEEFVKMRSQLIADVEFKLSERRREEDILEESTRSLAEHRSLLVQTDTEYSYATQELASKRKGKIKRLTRRIHELDEELEETNQTKVSILSPLARRAKSRKKAELTRKLDIANVELESAVEALEADQEKLRDAYEKRKQAIMEQVQSLEKKVSGSESDGSMEARKVACEALLNAVKALLQRKMSLK